MLSYAGVEEIASRAKLAAEPLDALLRSLERADAAVLHDRRDVARRVEQNLLGALAERRIADGDVAKAQPRHRVRLAEGVEGNRPLVHAGQRRDADLLALERSEERRVGKECRYRWSLCH